MTGSGITLDSSLQVATSPLHSLCGSSYTKPSVYRSRMLIRCTPSPTSNHGPPTDGSHRDTLLENNVIRRCSVTMRLEWGAGMEISRTEVKRGSTTCLDRLLLLLGIHLLFDGNRLPPVLVSFNEPVSSIKVKYSIMQSVVKICSRTCMSVERF